MALQRRSDVTEGSFAVYWSTRGGETAAPVELSGTHWRPKVPVPIPLRPGRKSHEVRQRPLYRKVPALQSVQDVVDPWMLQYEQRD